MGSKVVVTPEGNFLLRRQWFTAAMIDARLRNALISLTWRAFADAGRASVFNSQSTPAMSSSEGENSDFEILSGSESDNYAPAKKVCLVVGS